ncbi:hypothetical protein BBOH_0268 [Bifidobacterium bohemicum DSM 22767]|uniref:Uncharacterized protein n=1 Tax=Bifidobacterium bohemicum DSM 22767 TaxID=1437606 RepID=A0A086ZJU6_9BIFI|nr:hypothetical protein BBOH_0268 [Bifidobacterium bohemicum DSM 22767]
MVGLASNDAYSLVALFLPIASALLSAKIIGLETSGRMDVKWGSLGCSAVRRFILKLFVTGFVPYLCFALPQLGAFLVT